MLTFPLSEDFTSDRCALPIMSGPCQIRPYCQYLLIVRNCFISLAQVLGTRVLRWFYILLVVGCVLSLAVLAIVKVGPGILLFAPLLLVLVLKPLICVWQSKRLADIDARTARFESVLLVFLLLSLLLQQTPG